MTNLKTALLKEIELDETEYCFDKSYCTDEQWFHDHGTETRQEAFTNAMDSFNEMSVENIIEFFGDKYDFLVSKLNK